MGEAELAKITKVFSHGDKYQIQLLKRGGKGTMTRFTATPSPELLAAVGEDVRKALNIKTQVAVQKRQGQYPQYVIVDIPTEGE